MGARFGNLQVRELPIKEALELVPDGLVRQFNDQWTTITSENLKVGEMEKAARKLSKRTERPILSVEVFDDDVLIMSVFRNGKRVFNHTWDCGSNVRIGNPAVFVRELALPDGYAPYLRWIFKCESLGRKAELLENLGIPVWVDYRDILESEIDDSRFCPNLSNVEEYVKQQKALNKIKNATKANLLMEFDGQVHYVKLGGGMFLIQRPCPDSNYRDFKEFYVYAPQPDGSLAPLFNATGFCYRFGTRVRTNCRGFAVTHGFGPDKGVLYFYDDQGRLLDRGHQLDEPAFLLTVDADNGAILGSYGENSVLMKYGLDGSKLWEFEAPHLSVYPVVRGEHIYFHYTDNHSVSRIVKMDGCGKVIAALDLGFERGWETFEFDDDGSLHYFGNGSLLHIGEDLEILSEARLEDYYSLEGRLDTGNRKIYLADFEKQLLAVDMLTELICSQKKYQEEFNLMAVDASGRLLVVKGMSTVEVFDSDLNIISRHRVKGIIHHDETYRNSNGNVCFVTLDMPRHAQYGDNVKSTVRVYEIS